MGEARHLTKHRVPEINGAWADRGRHVVCQYRDEYAVYVGPNRVTDELSYTQARAQAGLLNKADAEAAKPKRTCMTCRDPFTSEGPHNRMCYPCRSSAQEDVMANPYSRGVGVGLSRRA